MNYKELVNEVTRLLDEFQEDKQCIDSFTEDTAKDLKNLSSSDQKFIIDTFYGCIMHKKLLDVVVNIFYNHHGKKLFRVDRNLFIVVCYLAMFCLDDLGLDNFSRIIKSLDISKMHKFLSFFFNISNLTTHIQREWSHIYDAVVVDKNWITPLLRWCIEIEVLLDQLAKKMGRGNLPKKSPRKNTKPREFDLTQPKARPLPAPEVIPQQDKSKPVPTTTHRSPKEPEILDDMKQRNRQKALQILNDANSQQFRCANPQKSEKTQNVISQILQSHDAELQFDKLYTSGSPATQKINSLPVRLNTTAILREGVLYNRLLEEELQRLERLSQGASEPSAFLQWQKEMKEKDLQEELAELERRRLEGRISHEEAVLARERVLEHNHHKAQQTKEETAELMRKYAEKRLKEEKEMRELVQQVADGHKNSKAAKAKLHEIKQRIVKEVSEHSRELLSQALEEAQVELSRKMELIRQIRAFESVPLVRQKFVDDTETAGHDLLCEMSLAELRERLALLREFEQSELEDRRQRIFQEKQLKEQLLLEQLDNIALRRSLAEQAVLRSQEEKRMRNELREAVSRDERVLTLQKTLEQKQQERQKRKTEKNSMKKNEQVLPLTVKTTLNKKQVLDEQHWQELERNLEQQIYGTLQQSSKKNGAGQNHSCILGHLTQAWLTLPQ
ncbi:cilia- and flagella-associated protein 99 isoform X4 [Onychostoma macrolepis]|uniref:cilia- and flagella-associated protein 99 isoform X4 n=1 Tax=Onychostoma macrolepis TaxID=369639 RepID=UPI00272DBD79|nr:cilia- and flagella-associated protein 99 isoform X4 [Onychostoma macrolepis]